MTYDSHDFSNSYLYKLHHLAESFYAVLDQRARLDTGIGLSHAILLTVIDQQQPISQQQVATFLDITPGAVSRQVELAIQNGWIIVHEDQYDHRKQLLVTTPEGKQVVRDIYDRLKDLADTILEHKGEKLDLMSHLEHLQENVDSIKHT